MAQPLGTKTDALWNGGDATFYMMKDGSADWATTYAKSYNVDNRNAETEKYSKAHPHKPLVTINSFGSIPGNTYYLGFPATYATPTHYFPDRYVPPLMKAPDHYVRTDPQARRELEQQQQQGQQAQSRSASAPEQGVPPPAVSADESRTEGEQGKAEAKGRGRREGKKLQQQQPTLRHQHLIAKLTGAVEERQRQQRMMQQYYRGGYGR